MWVGCISEHFVDFLVFLGGAGGEDDEIEGGKG